MVGCQPRRYCHASSRDHSLPSGVVVVVVGGAPQRSQHVFDRFVHPAVCCAETTARGAHFGSTNPLAEGLLGRPAADAVSLADLLSGLPSDLPVDLPPADSCLTDLAVDLLSVGFCCHASRRLSLLVDLEPAADQAYAPGARGRLMMPADLLQSGFLSR